MSNSLKISFPTKILGFEIIRTQEITNFPSMYATVYVSGRKTFSLCSVAERNVFFYIFTFLTIWTLFFNSFNDLKYYLTTASNVFF